MSRMAVIQVVCDLCGDKFDENDAMNFKMQNGTDPMVEVDACLGCSDALTPFFSAARTVIIPKVAKQKKDASLHPQAGYQPPVEKPRNVPCTVKGCDFMGMSLQSVATHSARMHGPKKAAKS